MLRNVCGRIGSAAARSLLEIAVFSAAVLTGIALCASSATELRVLDRRADLMSRGLRQIAVFDSDAGIGVGRTFAGREFCFLTYQFIDYYGTVVTGCRTPAVYSREEAEKLLADGGTFFVRFDPKTGESVPEDLPETVFREWNVLLIAFGAVLIVGGLSAIGACLLPAMSRRRSSPLFHLRRF